MKFVVSLAFCAPEHIVPLARAAETAGFEALSVSDHVVHPENIQTAYPYTPDGKPRWEPFTPWPDPLITVAAMATATTRIRFLTGVYVLPMRNVFLAAKSIATAAVLSDDRLILGLGAGWMREEFALLQQEFRNRGRRMDEMLEVLHKLWTGKMVEHHGEFYDFERLEMTPAPRQPIPIWVGGISEPALRRVARIADGWHSDLLSTPEHAERIERLRKYRADSPRAEDPLSILVSCTDAFDLDAYRKLEEIGVTHLLTLPWIFYDAHPDSLEEKIEGLARFGEDVIERMNP